MGQGVIALDFKDKHTPSPLRGTPPASGGERRTGAIASGENKEDGTPTRKSRNRLPIAGLPYFITFAGT